MREKLKVRVMSEIDMTKDLADAEIGKVIDRCIVEETKESYVPLKEKVGLRVELFNSLRRLDVLTELLEDEAVSEKIGDFLFEFFLGRDGRVSKNKKAVFFGGERGKGV